MNSLRYTQEHSRRIGRLIDRYTTAIRLSCEDHRFKAEIEDNYHSLRGILGSFYRVDYNKFLSRQENILENLEKKLVKKLDAA